MAASRTVLIEVTVEPVEGNDSDFWEPSNALVAWGVAELVLGKGKDDWKIVSVFDVIP